MQVPDEGVTDWTTDYRTNNAVLAKGATDQRWNPYTWPGKSTGSIHKQSGPATEIKQQISTKSENSNHANTVTNTTYDT